MKITKTSKENYKAGGSLIQDEPEGTTFADTFKTDKKGMPFQCEIKITYLDESDVSELTLASRAFIEDLEKDKNQLNLDVKTGEVNA